MKIISWNVNGIRAIAKKGFLKWFKEEDADIICLQETKAFAGQLDDSLRNPEGYHAVWHEGTRPGYSGTVIFSKNIPRCQTTSFDDYFHFHEHGRVVEAKFPGFTLLNVYVPNGQVRANGDEQLSYKLDFLKDFLKYMNHLREKGESVIACGDFNVCHNEIDIARPKENEDSIGFLPVERMHIEKIIESGFADAFRYIYPRKKDAYTWWSYRTKARERNVGWRIDYFFVSPDLKMNIKKMEHLEGVMGSDHCPLLLEI